MVSIVISGPHSASMPHAAIAIGSAERVCTWIVYTAAWRRRQAVRCLWRLFHGVIGRQRLQLRHGQISNNEVQNAARWMRLSIRIAVTMSNEIGHFAVRSGRMHQVDAMRCSRLQVADHCGQS